MVKRARAVTYHLAGGHADGLDREFAATHVEEVLETGPQEINDEDVVQAFLSKVVYLWDAGWGWKVRLKNGTDKEMGLTAAGEDAVGATFVTELGSLCLARFLWGRGV